MKRIDRIWLDEIISDEARQRDGGKNGGQTSTSCLISRFFFQALSTSRAETIDYFVPSTCWRHGNFSPDDFTELRERNDKNGSDGRRRLAKERRGRCI